ncbi:glutathione synthetase, chloroplastic-like [Chenopodium quinoa]|uniref:glutathione synthetase, chloroplastic-like n=1 Tax=Chenopodium quinoa TaxID=63459 RepID=UPI000B792EC7|nr:glutathione synthetase, chloroplastic-like [Chenopodium quinoa]
MGSGCSTLSTPTPNHTLFYSLSSTLPINNKSNSFNNLPTSPFYSHLPNLSNTSMSQFSSPSSSILPLNSTKSDSFETQQQISEKPIFNPHDINPNLLQKLVYDALVWCSLHGLLVGDRTAKKSGTVPGVGMVHAPISLLPASFPEDHFKQACELAPIFNELFDRVSLDAKFLQDSLSRTRKVDEFTSRLLDIHSKMIDINKIEEIRLGLHRSDYMLDAQTKSLLQIEFNTISSSFAGLMCLVSDLHRNLLGLYGNQLQLDFRKVPENASVQQFAKALAEAWREYNNPRAVVLVVVQAEERNMYDQLWLSDVLREIHGVTSIRKTLAEIDAEGKLLPDGTLAVNGEAVAVVYFRAGYSPTDYPSELEWRARQLIEQSCAVKCPSIAYHLAGTKKIQQELAKPNVLERFLDDKEDIAKLRKCFAGLWSLDDTEIITDAIERPELYVMKPQREGGGNNIYGNEVKEAMLRIQKGGSEEDAAYILMQRIFPTVFPALLVREGIFHKDHAISELGIYGAYLRNKENIIINEQCGYLMRTKVSSSDEGGVAAGFAVLDSLYLS